MPASLDEIVENLAQTLQRSVTVDDADQKLLGYSTHFEDPDPARLNALVGRGPTGAMLAYVSEQKVRSWRQPTRLPQSPEHGFLHSRMAFPLRSRYELLGFMWVIDDIPMAEDELEACRRAADDLTVLLERRAQAQHENEAEADLVFDLVASDAELRTTAVTKLAALGSLDGYSAAAVMVVTVSTSPPTDRGILNRAIARASLSRSRESVAFGVRDGDAIVLIGTATGSEAKESAHTRDVADRVVAELGRIDKSLVVATHIGLGRSRALDDLDASYAQALSAVQAARRGGDTTAVWEEHPFDALLDAAVREDIDGRLIPPVLTEVLAGSTSELLEMLEVFLEHAGNVAETSNALHLHRTTVYYRLTKFTEITGIDLEDGKTRLMIHLWLTLRRRGDLAE